MDNIYIYEVQPAVLLRPPPYTFTVIFYANFCFCYACLSTLSDFSVLVAFHVRRWIALALFVTTRTQGEAFYPILTLSKYIHLTMFFIFLGLLFGLCYTGGSPFIYGAF